jgi:membrane protein
MIRYFKHCLKIFKIATKRFFKEQYTYRASALAFTTLLSLVPLLTVIVFLTTKFTVFNQINLLAQNYILTNFIPTSTNTIQFYLNNFTFQATHLPKLGIIFLLLTAMMLILTIEHTMNDIWEVRWENRRLWSLLLYWIVLLSAPLMIGLGIFISTYLFSLSWVSEATQVLGLKAPFLAILPLFINTIIFSLLYIVVPNFSVNWWDAIFGGFIAALIFELAKISFAFYIARFPSYELIYGALAAIPIFLLWLYISWLIILFGALVTHAQYQHRTIAKTLIKTKIKKINAPKT